MRQIKESEDEAASRQQNMEKHGTPGRGRRLVTDAITAGTRRFVLHDRRGSRCFWLASHIIGSFMEWKVVLKKKRKLELIQADVEEPASLLNGTIKVSRGYQGALPYYWMGRMGLDR